LVYRCGYFEDCHSEPRVTPNGEESHGPASYCRIYHFRHRLCRFYPRQRLYGHPKTHPECGFQFVRRDGKPSFDDVLSEKMCSNRFTTETQRTQRNT
jgi:hypothetical protein